MKNLRDKFLSLKLVFIQLDNEEDAYLIFETLNARGRDLRTPDLVKNLLLKTIKSSNSSLDSPKQAWNTIINRFDDASDNNIIDTFILHYWISKVEYSTEKKLFSNVKQFINEKQENAKILLTDLGNHSKQYCMMINPNTQQWAKEEQEVRNSLTALNIFKVKQQSSFVLALLVAYTERRLTLRQLKQTLQKIENFHLLFNAITQQRSSGSIATMYSQHAISLSSAKNNDSVQKVLTSLTRKLNEKLPSYEEFEIKFSDLIYLSNKTSSKNVIKYSLCKLLGNTNASLDINHDSLSIEHLLPEAMIKQGQAQNKVGNIGNLLLIDTKTNNSSLKDKEPAEKIQILKASMYPLENNFITGLDWNEKSIDDRAKQISVHIYNLVSLK